MKTLHYINLVAYLITIGFYISIEYALYGAICQFFLGIIQLIIAIIISFRYKKLESNIKKLITYYWVSVFIVSIGIAIISYSSLVRNGFYELLVAFVIPMLIAAYFVFTTYQIQKS